LREEATIFHDLSSGLRAERKWSKNPTSLNAAGLVWDCASNFACAKLRGVPASSSQKSAPPSATTGQFAPTRWSVVLAAGRSDTTHAHAALEKLCRIYWPPIYAFVRRQGHSPHDAQDLTQEFFARLLGKNYLADVDRAKGKFRSFLLASLKHFLANEWDKAKAQKRGGGKVFVPIDAQDAETKFGIDPADSQSADKIFDRRWALTLLEQVLQRLRNEFIADGKEKSFEQLKPTLTEPSRAISYAEIAARLGTSEGAVKVAVHRLRQRYRELIRAEIAETVSSSAEVEDELRNLFAALSA
jgi:RNA polymerase sigma-70 factor (ECF subfamily)